MAQLFGDGQQRLAALLGRSSIARPETGTIAAIPSRKLALPTVCEEEDSSIDDDSEETVLGYQPLSGDKR